MHCCGTAPADDEDTDQTSKFDPCTACGNDANGSCYSALAFVKYEWDMTSSNSTAAGWQDVYNKDERSELLGPPSSFSPASFSRHNQTTAGNTKNVYKYRLLWRALDGGTTADDNPGTWQTSNSETPPAGLVAAGEGADPGLFDVDSTTGTISALPRRNGNFSMYLLAVDTAGTAAASFGLPAELDQVVVKRWDFTVVGKPDFVVTEYNRLTGDSLPPVSSGEDPFITRKKVGSIDCTNLTHILYPQEHSDTVQLFLLVHIHFICCLCVD